MSEKKELKPYSRKVMKSAMMPNKISVKVKPNSKENLVEPAGENQYIVRVKEKAIEGKANEAVIKTLSEYFDIPRGRIAVIVGSKSRNKVINIS